jgi:Flp pilus assembly pilin Flp
MLPIAIRLPLAALHLVVLQAGRAVAKHRSRLGGEQGQTSAEYALVLLGAATVALLIALWAKNTDALGNLLDSIFESISGMVT